MHACGFLALSRQSILFSGGHSYLNACINDYYLYCQPHTHTHAAQIHVNSTSGYVPHYIAAII